MPKYAKSTVLEERSIASERAKDPTLDVAVETSAQGMRSERGRINWSSRNRAARLVSRRLRSLPSAKPGDRVPNPLLKGHARGLKRADAVLRWRDVVLGHAAKATACQGNAK